MVDARFTRLLARDADRDYERTIAPTFAGRCAVCQRLARRRGGLVLAYRTNIRAGAKHGPVIQPGKPGASEMLRRLRLPADHEDPMPQKGKPKPAPEEIRRLEAWIDAGAPFERGLSVRGPGRRRRPGGSDC